MDWLVVTSPENFECTRQLGFTVQGFKEQHRRRVQGLAPGDRLAYYLTGVGCFAGCTVVRSLLFEERSRIWNSPGQPEELYPWRVKIERDLAPPTEACPLARDVVARLQFVKRWPAEHWRLAFQGMLRELPAADFDLIREELWSGVKLKGLEGHPG